MVVVWKSQPATKPETTEAALPTVIAFDVVVPVLPKNEPLVIETALVPKELLLPATKVPLRIVVGPLNPLLVPPRVTEPAPVFTKAPPPLSVPE